MSSIRYFFLVPIILARTLPAPANENSAAKMNARVEAMQLTGAGQLITTCDSGIDTGDLATLHADLRSNVVGFACVFDNLCSQTDIVGHGTHTAGSIVGTGAMSDGRYKGIGYGAKLWAWFGGTSSGDGVYTPYTVDEAFRPIYQSSYKNCGLVSHFYSASFGSDGATHLGVYEQGTADIDEYCWNHPDFLPVYAAANDGPDPGTISAEATSKNALVVGATGDYYAYQSRTDDGNQVAKFSSRGPCRDGRTKPDVVSPGCWVISVRSSAGLTPGWGAVGQYYEYMGGTSQATPLTAGMCALVREWLIRYCGFNEKDQKPTSALMKAIVMGGAVDIGADKNAQGAGRTDLASSIAPTDGRAVYLRDRIPFADGLRTTFSFTTTKTAPLDVQLVWVDYPGTPVADKTAPMLVNDLDLELRDASGAHLAYGNGGTEPDRLNNAESIRLANLPAGAYKLIVRSGNIPFDSTRGGAAALYLKGAFKAEDVTSRDNNRPPPKILWR